MQSATLTNPAGYCPDHSTGVSCLIAPRVKLSPPAEAMKLV